MSLYHETAEILTVPESTGGNLKTRIFGKKDLKTSKQQVYALALETCKWSSVLKEVIENADLLRHEPKLTPVLALLLVHDFIISKGGIALPASHGLRSSIERHKARLNAEFTRARLRRKAASLDALKQQVEEAYAAVASPYPRWVRVNTLLSTLEDQLETTFKSLSRVYSIKDVLVSMGKAIYLDEHIPNLVAVSPSFQFVKTDAYKSGKIILQDKASCFPAYLLDPRSEDGDVIDSCSAPGNKTTHLAAIIHSRMPESEKCQPKVFAFEMDWNRSKTLDKMVKLAGAKEITHINSGHDFLKVDPKATLFKNVGALLLDPSCSGSGIVGRDAMPPIHFPMLGDAKSKKDSKNDQSRKRKRGEYNSEDKVLVDDDGQQTVVSSEKEMKARLEALSAFQLVLLEHAFKFPSAKKITYSTCSIHAQENEQVVLKALQSDIAKQLGWRILSRDRQVRGMKEWAVRGSIEAADGDKTIAEACIRSYKGDGRGVMGFFVAAFVRDVNQHQVDHDGPYVRDEDGRIVRDMLGMPTLKPGHTSKSQNEEVRQHAGDIGSVPAADEARDRTEASSSSDDSDSDSGSAEDEEWGGFDD